MKRYAAVLVVVAALALPSVASASPPSISGFSPAGGPAGTLVTIVGGGFAGATRVTIGGPSASFNVLSAGKIVAVVPPLARTGVVTVTAPGGTTESRSVFSVDQGMVPFPGSAPPGGRFAVSGSGFGPSSGFTLELGGVRVGSGVTNAVGGFGAARVTVPVTEPLGSHVLSLLEPSGLSFAINILIQGDWTFGRQNVFGTGQELAEKTLSPSTAPGIVEKWAFSAASSLGDSTPIVAGGVLYTGSDDGHVYAVSTATHKVLWSVQPGSGIARTAAFEAGTLYVGVGGTVFALNAQTGKTKWSIATAGSLAGESPIVVNGHVYFVAADNNGWALWSVGAANGTVAWQRTLGTASFAGPPAFSAGTIYVGDHSGTLRAFDAASGTLDWSRKVGGGITTAPALGGGMAFVTAGDGSLTAFDAATGAKKWSKAVGADVGSPAFDAGKVFVAVSAGMAAFQGTTGNVLWSFLPGTQVTLDDGSPAVANGVVYGVYAREPIALAEASGALLWHANGQLSDDVSPPVVVDGRVFVGSGDGKVHVYG